MCLFFKIYFIFTYVYIGLCVDMCTYRCPWRPEALEVPWSWTYRHLWVTRIWVLCKSSNCSLQLGHLSSFLFLSSCVFIIFKNSIHFVYIHLPPPTSPRYSPSSYPPKFMSHCPSSLLLPLPLPPPLSPACVGQLVLDVGLALGYGYYRWVHTIKENWFSIGCGGTLL